MSRCSVKPREDHDFEISEVVLGWDRPLQRWFFQVWKPDSAEPFIDEWCENMRLLELFLAYADQKNEFTRYIGSAILTDRCPMKAYNHPTQWMHWETTKLNPQEN